MSIYYGIKNSNREYIVVKHQLSGITTEVLGIRYMDGFGVVAKDSKEHKRLKQVRMAVVDEYPITFLTKIKSVINKTQIKVIWGSDVYRCFLQHEAKKQAQPVHLQKEVETARCKGTKADGSQCNSGALRGFSHCRAHIEQGKKIQPYIKDMKKMPTKQKRKFITEAIQKAREEHGSE
tara:strand:+ start:1973 stop:2506 length:534 start_codon:yes stop_codon:yes gene_type:complete